MSKIKYFFSAVGLILLPFVILGFLYGGNSIFERYGVNINPSGISNKEIYSFWGSYLAGLATLAAVLLTIKHNNKMVFATLKHNADMNLYQRRSAYYDKERENISKALSKINPSIVGDLYDQYKTDLYAFITSQKKNLISSTSNDIAINKSIDLDGLLAAKSALLKQLLSEQTLLLNARNELLLTTDILTEYENYTKCPKKTHCEIYKYRTEFQKSYKIIDDNIRSGLYSLQKTIQDGYEYLSLGDITHVLRAKYDSLANGIEKDDYGKNIADWNKKRDAINLIPISVDFDKMSKVVFEDKPKLIESARLYYVARTSKEHETCPNNF